MRAHLVAVSESLANELESGSDDQIYELLTGPGSVDLDKSWEAVFPLVGSIAGTGDFLVEEPRPIGGDIGFGPAMFIDSGEVKAMAAKLSGADDGLIASHWAGLDSPFMQPGMYDDDMGKEFAMDGYRRTVDLFAAAAAASDGVLFAIL